MYLLVILEELAVWSFVLESRPDAFTLWGEDFWVFLGRKAVAVDAVWIAEEWLVHRINFSVFPASRIPAGRNEMKLRHIIVAVDDSRSLLSGLPQILSLTVLLGRLGRHKLGRTRTRCIWHLFITSWNSTCIVFLGSHDRPLDVTVDDRAAARFEHFRANQLRLSCWLSLQVLSLLHWLHFKFD